MTASLERIRLCQEILNDFARAASETRQLRPLLQVACVQAARGIGIAHTKVMRYRPAKGDLLVEAGVGWKPGMVGRTTLGTDIASAPGRALQSSQPVRIDDLPNDPEYRYPPSLCEHGIISVLNVPVSVDGAVWGVLEVDSDTPRHFSRDDLVFLSAMAGVLGLAIQSIERDESAKASAIRADIEIEQQRMLMRELAHRDKNDFQMIISILLMQMHKQQDLEAVQGFKLAIDRVSAISLAHDQLAMRPGQPTIDVANYLQALCGNLAHRSEGVAIETALESTEITHERAVALGLITNELATNAIKHAFPDGKGTIRVELTADPAGGQGCLILADDGIGMAAARPGGSGLHLIKALSGQIGGTVQREGTERGTAFRISFLLVR
ncbi:hypothetical protein [Azospirillum doebereinerae]